MALPVKDIKTKLAAVRRGRQDHEAVLNTIRTFLRPATPNFRDQRKPTTIKRSHILDNTGEEASETLASYLHGALFPQGMKWFELTLPGRAGAAPEEAIKRHLAGDTAQMFRLGFEHPDSNFAAASADWCQDFVDFAYATFWVEEVPGKPPVCMTLDAAECYLVFDQYDRPVELWRVFRMTAKQAVAQWPTGLSKAVTDAAADPKSEHQEFEFVHWVYERPDGSPSTDDPKKLPWASVYYETAGDNVIREGGYPEKPFMAVRWSGKGYGRGRGHKAINDIVMLQRLMKAQVEGAETLIHPPLTTPDDGILGKIKMYGGAVNVARSEWLLAGRSPIMPISTGARVDIAEAMIEGMRQRIRTHFHGDKLFMNRDPRMTATQALQEAATLSTLLAGPNGRIQTGFLSDLIPRVHGILQRNGWLADPPQGLRERQVDITYLSPFARQQQVQEASGIAQFTEVSTTLLEPHDPGVTRRTIDVPKAADRLAQSLNVPIEVRVPARAAEEMRAQDAQQRAQAAEMEQVATMANAAAQAGAAQERFGRAGAA